MNKFTGFMQNKVINSKKGKIAYLSVMGTAFAIFAVFLILFILSVAAPHVYFTDRDNWDMLTDKIKDTVYEDEGVYSDSLYVSPYAVIFTYIVPPKGSSANYEYFLVSIKLDDEVTVYYIFDVKSGDCKFNVTVKYDGSYTHLYNTYRVKTDGELKLLYGDESDSDEKNLARTAIKLADYVLTQGLRRLDSSLSFSDLKEELASFIEKTDSIFVASLVLFIIFLGLGIAMFALFFVFKKKAKNAPRPVAANGDAMPEQQPAANESALIQSVSHMEFEERSEDPEQPAPEPAAAPEPVTKPEPDPVAESEPAPTKKSKATAAPEPAKKPIADDDYKYCMFCGTKLKSVARFCTKCGSKLDD